MRVPMDCCSFIRNGPMVETDGEFGDELGTRLSSAAQSTATVQDEHTLRLELIHVARKLNSTGLSAGTSGTVSIRIGNEMLITPTGAVYDALRPQDVVKMSLDGSVAPGQLKPSSEWHFHAALYRQYSDVSAIVHCHSVSATALACCGRSIPAFHYMVAVAGGHDIRCAPYATFGTDELAQNAVDAITDRRACLLANHGQIAVGETASQALALAVEVETLSQHYIQALQIGNVQLLHKDEMEHVLKKFETYGQQD